MHEDLGRMKIEILNLKNEALDNCSRFRPLDGQSFRALDGQ